MIFRSYAIERIAESAGNKWIAAAISFATFLAVNWSGWEPVQTIVAGFTGLVLTALYLWRRNAYVNMIARFIAVGAGYLLR